MKKATTSRSTLIKGHQSTRSARPTIGAPVGAVPARQSPAVSAVTRESLLELEYADEIFQYMKQMEKETMAVPEYMDLQPELTWDLRPLLVDFLIEIHNHFNLQPETLYLTMNMMDRYLSKRVVYKKHYQLVGMTSLWVASKYEDSKEKLPSVAQLCKLCSNTYDESAFITMERYVLKTLEFSLGHPTAEAFLKRDLELSSNEEQVVRHVAQFLMEITLFQRCFLSFGSSAIATSALYLARNICGKQPMVRRMR
ncbi:cyclin-like protein [Mortierella sp. GBAus27b]|nr:cyclin-like protein [Mortierella sp. GBAus27b]